DTIAFFKVENDGFGLGAQRRAIEKNDLPQVQAELATYLQALRSKASIETILSLTSTAQIVPKEKIASNGDYTLSGERYRKGTASNHSFPLVFLGEENLFRVESGGTPKSDVEEYWGGGIPWATLVDLPATDFISEIATTKRTISDKGLRESSAKMIPANSIVVSTRATIGRIAINRVPIATNQGFKNVIIEDLARAVPEYVALALTKLVPTMQAWATGGTFAEISKTKFCELQIPLPPLEVQKEIVAEIEGYQKVINGAHAVIDNYRPHIPIDPEWPMVELGKVLQKSDETVLPESLSGTVTYIGLENISQRTGEICGNIVSENPADIKSLKNVFKAGEILYGKLRPNLNKVWLADRAGICSTDILVLRPVGNHIITGFYASVLKSESFNATVMSHIKGAQLPRVGWPSFASILVPLPPLATQHAIVTEIEAEQKLVAASQELIARFKKKIQTTLARIWGEEKPDPMETKA
ncbi:MAG: restriction endonuclease subunit S, partial [Deltaproteobacteria bacterium]|nr:restriction endonuclease subunit S [Deltaproteobacteria bacterium]